MSHVVDVAQAVVDLLNAASLGVVAVRSYVPQYELSEMDEPHITVVPKSMDVTREDRARHRYTVVVDVAVQQRASADADIDTLMDFVQTVAEVLRDSPTEGIHPVSVANDPIYSPEELKERRLLVSLLTATYMVVE